VAFSIGAVSEPVQRMLDLTGMNDVFGLPERD
jgi:hypothetical protein